MSRPLRIHVPGAFYHVTLRGNHQQAIFFTPADRTLLEEIIRDVISRFATRVHAYCWMNNHVHLLMQVDEMPLGRLMLRIASRYARTVQARLETTGHLFERRYHAALVAADDYLLELLRYIHLNPVRAGMVDSPAEYEWSSHLDYLGRRTRSWLTTDVALQMFHIDRTRAIAAYGRFIAAAHDAIADQEPRPPESAGSGVLPGDEFASRLESPSWNPKSTVSLANLIGEGCIRFGVTRDALVSFSRQRRLVAARAWIAHEAVAQRVASLSSVARALGRSESSLRESVKHRFDGC
jgi:REP element-mobilizing transposase RayT